MPGGPAVLHGLPVRRMSGPVKDGHARFILYRLAHLTYPVQLQDRQPGSFGAGMWQPKRNASRREKETPALVRRAGVVASFQESPQAFLLFFSLGGGREREIRSGSEEGGNGTRKKELAFG